MAESTDATDSDGIKSTMQKNIPSPADDIQTVPTVLPKASSIRVQQRPTTALPPIPAKKLSQKKAPPEVPPKPTAALSEVRKKTISTCPK
jgi:hypothetical protein